MLVGLCSDQHFRDNEAEWPRKLQAAGREGKRATRSFRSACRRGWERAFPVNMNAPNGAGVSRFALLCVFHQQQEFG